MKPPGNGVLGVGVLLAADRGERDGRDVIRRLEVERVRVASNTVISASEVCPMCRRVD